MGFPLLTEFMLLGISVALGLLSDFYWATQSHDGVVSSGAGDIFTRSPSTVLKKAKSSSSPSSLVG